MDGGQQNIRLLIAVLFAICIFDIAYVWRTVEHDLLASDDSQWKHQSHRQRRKSRQQLEGGDLYSQNASIYNFTVDPEQLHAFNILRDAGVLPTPDLISLLPRWSNIVAQYGSEPIIHNLESCADFRASTPKEIRFTGVAGMFNTGTNLLGDLMIHNCQIDGHQGGTGMRAQVPWGKHNPPGTHRLKNVAQVGGAKVNQTAVFPTVIIKDPYHWIISQCRHKYSTLWEHDSEHCPNIVSWRSETPTNVHVKYAMETRDYNTFVGMWNEWYGEYENHSSLYPIAYVRFEDILFHAVTVVNALCRCVGGRRRRGPFKYVEDSAKNSKFHPGSNGLLNAMIRYGDPKKRLEGWSKEDWEYARDHLDQKLMNKYGYSRPAWP